MYILQLHKEGLNFPFVYHHESLLAMITHLYRPIARKRAIIVAPSIHS